MKKLLLFLIAVSMYSTSIYAQAFIDKGIEIVFHREIPPKETITDPENTPKTRGVFIQPAYAYIYNNIVTITFEEAMPSATITLVNTSTGETVYSETHTNPTSVNIDLDAESSGEYQLEIVSDETCLQGSFAH